MNSNNVTLDILPRESTKSISSMYKKEKESQKESLTLSLRVTVLTPLE